MKIVTSKPEDKEMFKFALEIYKTLILDPNQQNNSYEATMDIAIDQAETLLAKLRSLLKDKG